MRGERPLPDFALNGPALQWFCTEGAKLERSGTPIEQVIFLAKARQRVQEHNGITLQTVIEGYDHD